MRYSFQTQCKQRPGCPEWHIKHPAHPQEVTLKRDQWWSWTSMTRTEHSQPTGHMHVIRDTFSSAFLCGLIWFLTIKTHLFVSNMPFFSFPRVGIKPKYPFGFLPCTFLDQFHSDLTAFFFNYHLSSLCNPTRSQSCSSPPVPWLKKKASPHSSAWFVSRPTSLLPRGAPLALKHDTHLDLAFRSQQDEIWVTNANICLD